MSTTLSAKKNQPAHLQRGRGSLVKILLVCAVGLCIMSMILLPMLMKDDRAPGVSPVDSIPRTRRIWSGTKSGSEKWDAPTVLLTNEKAPRFKDNDVQRQNDQDVKSIAGLRAVAPFHLIEEVPEANNVVNLLVQSPDHQRNMPRIRTLHQTLRHLQAWHLAMAEYPDASHFVILEGSFDIQVAPDWDNTLSELFALADREVPGWGVLTLSQRRFASVPSWECAHHFEGISLSGVMLDSDMPEFYDFDAYAVAVSPKVRDFVKPYQRWQAGAMSARMFAVASFTVPFPLALLRSFRVYFTTVPWLLPPAASLLAPAPDAPPISKSLRQFWASRRKCSHSVSSQPSGTPSALHSTSRCEGSSSTSPRLRAPPIAQRSNGSHCGGRWDVPALYLNLDSASRRRERMEAQIAALQPVARIQRQRGVDVKDEEVAALWAAHQKYQAEEGDAVTGRVELAVLLAHLTALDRGERESEGASPYFVVMEDDVDFETVRHWDATLSEVLAQADAQAPDWEIINLGCSNWQFFRSWEQCRLAVHPYELHTKHHSGRPSPLFFGLVLYAVRRGPGLQRLLQPLREYRAGKLAAAKLVAARLTEPADWMLYKQLRAYVGTTPLLLSGGLQSQILPGREAGHALFATDVKGRWRQRAEGCVKEAPAAEGVLGWVLGTLFGW